MTQMEIIQKNLRAARKSRGWTMKQVEEVTNGRWKAVTVGTYERGNRMVAVDDLIDLASVYEVSISWLMGVECETCATTLRITQLEQELNRLKGKL